MRKNRHSILSLSACALFGPDHGGGGGSSKPATIEAQLTEAQSLLVGEQGKVTSLTTERDQAQSALTAITAERDNLQSQFTALTETASKTKTDLTAAQSTIATLTSERDTAHTTLATSKANTARLESLCSIKGIDHANAVPPATEPTSLSEADFGTRISSAKTPAERAAIVSEFEKAVADKRI
jgi:septal ring factor EnvC (AmiA/AmiB activator)